MLSFFNRKTKAQAFEVERRPRVPSQTRAPGVEASAPASSTVDDAVDRMAILGPLRIANPSTPSEAAIAPSSPPRPNSIPAEKPIASLFNRPAPAAAKKYDIWQAAERGDLEVLAYYCAKDPHLLDTLSPPNLGGTRRYPLAVASRANQRKAVELLLGLESCGNATINEKDDDHMAALQYAIEADAQKIVGLLLRAGACPRSYGPALPGQKKQFFTDTLQYAVYLGRVQCVRLLLTWHKVEARDGHGLNLKDAAALNASLGGDPIARRNIRDALRVAETVEYTST